MTGDDFCAWAAKLCVLEQQGSAAEFVAALRNFAAEAGVTLLPAEIRNHFQLDDGTLGAVHETNQHRLNQPQ